MKKAIYSILCCLSYFASTAAHSEVIVLGDNDYYRIDENTTIKCESGQTETKEFKCVINTTVGGKFYRAVGFGTTEETAEQRARRNCVRETGSSFACSLVGTECSVN